MCFVRALYESKIELAAQLQQLNIKEYLQPIVFLKLVSNRMHEKCGFEATKGAKPRRGLSLTFQAVTTL